MVKCKYSIGPYVNAVGLELGRQSDKKIDLIVFLVKISRLYKVSARNAWVGGSKRGGGPQEKKKQIC